MPNTIILTNAFFAVGTGTASADRNISNRLKKLTWNESFDDHDVTVMGSTTRVRAIGLGEADISAEVMQAYDTGDAGENIDQLVENLRTVSQAGLKFLVRMRPYSANRTATNPEYSMLAVMGERTIFDGQVGDPLGNTLTFLSAGDITRATATT
jgi:hypothetical protein